MNPAGAIAMTAVIWALMSVGSTALRVLLYSLPIPLTIAILSGASGLAGGQYLGIVLLVAFWYLTALFELWTHTTVAVFAAVAVYLGVAAAIHRWIEFPAVTAFVVSAGLLLVHGLASRWWSDPRGEGPPPRPRPREYAVVPLTTSLTWALGGFLGPFVVTFPYSGVPTALALRGGAFAFAVAFGNRAWMLLGFLGAYHLAHVSMSREPALLVGWAFFLLAMAVLLATGARPVTRAGRAT